MIRNKIKGFYVYDFLDCKRMNQIYGVLESKLQQIGYHEYKFPSLGLLEDLSKERSHFSILAETFSVQDKPLFLKPTSEAVAYPMVYSDQTLKLPFRWYSKNSVFRNETKRCQKYLRSRQIAFFFEAHSVYSSEAKARSQYYDLRRVIKEFLDELNIPTIASIRPLEDTFPGAVETTAFDTIVNDEFVQVGTLHYLGDNFSRAYRKSDHLYGLCFGFSERLLGVLKNIYSKDYKYFFNPYKVLEVTTLNLPLSRNRIRVPRFTKSSLLSLESTYQPLVLKKTGSEFTEITVVDTQDAISQDQVEKFVSLKQEILSKKAYAEFAKKISSCSDEKLGTRLDVL